MSSSPKVKVGFVGLSSVAGWASDAVAPSLLAPSVREKYDIVAVSTTSEATAKASAEKYSKSVGHSLKTYYGDASQIASDPDVDLVAITVKAPYHKEIALKAIEAKKDFFIEWPAGTSTKETEEIAEAARQQGVRSLVGLQGRHSAVIDRVKEILASGVIGNVRSTSVLAHIPRDANVHAPNSKESNTYILEKKNGVNILTIAIAHQLDTSLQHVLGEFASLTATEAKFYPTITIVTDDGKPTGKTFEAQCEDHFSITGFLKTGVFANVFWRTGYALKEGRHQFVWEIDGEEGSIKLQSDFLLGAYPSIFEPELFLNGEKVESETKGFGAIVAIGAAWTQFADKSKAGTYATIDDAVKHHRLIDAIALSAKEGKRVTL